MTELQYCNKKNCWFNDASECQLENITITKRGKCDSYQHYLRYFRRKLKRDWSDD